MLQVTADEVSADLTKALKLSSFRWKGVSTLFFSQAVETDSKETEQQKAKKKMDPDKVDIDTIWKNHLAIRKWMQWRKTIAA